jgi:hypothetical protein
MVAGYEVPTAALGRCWEDRNMEVEAGVVLGNKALDKERSCSYLCHKLTQVTPSQRWKGAAADSDSLGAELTRGDTVKYVEGSSAGRKSRLEREEGNSTWTRVGEAILGVAAGRKKAFFAGGT